MNKKQILKGLIVAILIVVLCASSYYVGVSSSYVGDTSEVWVNPPFSEASYVVGRYNSTYYYAKNGTTGKYDYLSTNFTYVLKTSLNNSPKGTYVYLKGGASSDGFYITETIYIPDQVGLEGVGWDYDSAVTIRCTSNIDYVWLCHEASWLKNVYLESVQTTFTHTMLTVNGSYCYVFHVNIVRGGAYSVGGTGLKVLAGKVIYSIFEQINIHGHFKYGCVLYNSGTFPNAYINVNQFYDIRVAIGDGGYGYVLNKTTNGDMQGNTFYSCTTDYGFNGTYIWINNAVDTTFFDFYTWDTVSGAILINITDSDAQDTAFIRGHLSWSNSPHIINNGLRTLFIDVDGFITASSGTAEASDTDTVSFGVTFAISPQTVVITVNENDARYIAQAYSITTTGFSLYLWDDVAGALETSDKTISWIAKYNP